MRDDPPRPDEIEVTVLSQGHGESIVVHVGHGQWIIVDSFRSQDRTAAPIRYLRGCGVNTAEHVRAVLLTHWHDDHVQGAADVVSACARARVAIPGVFLRDEFQAFLTRRVRGGTDHFTSGVDEMLSVFGVPDVDDRIFYCWSERLIADDPEIGFSFEALSSNNADYARMLDDMGARRADPSRRAMPSRKNDAAVAAVVTALGERLLLGADLETTDARRGWHAVHRTAWRGRGRGTFFKVPHHGSATADHAPVWDDMLVGNVHAALTPWGRGRRLPTGADVARILDRTGRAYAAS